MAKLIATIKAIITRLLFGAHGFVAIWQVARNKDNPIYWYLCAPIGLLFFEGIFTLAIKKNQEWRWFCPSVFLYLVSVVPAIWMLELDKIDRRLSFEKEAGNLNLTALGADLKKLDKLLGVQIKLPDIQVDPSMWITLIEQFLMLILIVGRWMLPKGDLTRDQLSQLLLVYIGTAADIIEFFDSYKDNTIASEPLLVFLTLGIWSWSLFQFTIVLSATRSRKPRGGGAASNQEGDEESNDCCGGCCCSIDIWGIALNIVLQDAPFLSFRLLIICHYNIISYMNVFFTCKNTLVILLQLYRLYVVHTENSKANKSKPNKSSKHYRKRSDVYVISTNKYDKKRTRRDASSDDDYYQNKKRKRTSKPSGRKDTGYSTASSQSSNEDSPRKPSKHKHHSRKDDDKNGSKREKERSKKHDEKKKRPKAHKEKELARCTEESGSSNNSSKYDVVHEKRQKNKKQRSISSSSYSSE